MVDTLLRILIVTALFALVPTASSAQHPTDGSALPAIADSSMQASSATPR